MMARAAASATTPPAAKTTKPAARAAKPDRKKTPLDRIYGRLQVCKRYLVRSHEEVLLFQAREAVDSQARPVLAELVRALDLDKRMTDISQHCEKLAKLEWAPKGAIVRATFEIGQKVEIATDKQGHFLRHGLYDASVISAPAKVEKVAGNQVVIKLKDGSFISPISAGWLRAVEEE